MKEVHGDYNLAATYCQPDSGPGKTIQILTHGVGFDRSYWDYPFNNYNYSYVDRAVEQGYSTLSWDRLGIAQSDHGKDPINEIQVTLEIEALRALTQKVHDGDACGIPAKFDKHVHVGHSFGSIMSYGLTSLYPKLSDAIILTGFSQFPNYMPYFVLGGNFAPVSSIDTLKDKYATGYIAPFSSIGVHINFFGPGDFDEDMLDDATKNGQPAALGELLNTGGPVGKPSEFGGDVLIITGDRDVPFCGGNCKDTSMLKDAKADNVLEISRSNFQKAKSFTATVVPDAGHGLNFGYSHTVTYKGMLDFLKDKSL
ncbi:hypothetical protein VHEMI02200 [[Torrubiella] hemipterigena]|nr:hypothetical protein VHEMI02200 [[Torrubiella] hemipterigena]